MKSIVRVKKNERSSYSNNKNPLFGWLKIKDFFKPKFEPTPVFLVWYMIAYEKYCTCKKNERSNYSNIQNPLFGWLKTKDFFKQKFEPTPVFLVWYMIAYEKYCTCKKNERSNYSNKENPLVSSKQNIFFNQSLSLPVFF